jgi:hypothetical protein
VKYYETDAVSVLYVLEVIFYKTKESRMSDIMNRRGFVMGTGALWATSAAGQESKETKLAVDRSGVVWGDRPMFLRPYHPPYLVTYYGMRAERHTIKWDPLLARIENERDLKIHIVECYDDACAGCAGLTTDKMGSLWGVGHSCGSSKNPETVAMVIRVNRRILGELDLDFGSEILFRDLVPLLARKVPVLYEGIGDAANQKIYEKGLADLKRKYGV